MPTPRGIIKQTLKNFTSGEDLKTRLILGGLGSAGLQAISRFLALGLSIVLARTLGAENYGVYAYAFAIMTLLTVVAEAGVPVLLMREVAASHSRNDWGLLSGAIRRSGQFVTFTATTIAASGLAIAWAVSSHLSTPMLHTTTLMLFVLPFIAANKTIGHALQGLQRVVLGQTIYVLLRPLITLFIVGIAFTAWPEFRQPQNAMAVQLLGAAAALVIGLGLLQRIIPEQAKLSVPIFRDKEWLKTALPFMLISSAGVINSQTDIIMLGWLSDTENVGIYRVAAQGAILVAFGLQVANTVLAPHFTRLYANGDMVRLQHLVTQSARVILLAALPITLIFIFAGGPIVTWVFGSDFTDAQKPLAILAAGQLANAAFGSVGYLLNMTGHEHISARILWLTVLLNAALNAIMIPFFGTTGAAFATTVSLIMWNALLFHQVQTQLNITSAAFQLKRS